MLKLVNLYIDTKVMIKFLFPILTPNKFIFNSIRYLQSEPSMYHHMWTFPWEHLNRHIFISISERNQQHSSIKFNFKYPKTDIEFLDTDGKLCLITYIYLYLIYLYFKSAQPPSVNKSASYSQALRISNICTETNEVTKHLAELIEPFLKRVYQ